MISLKLAKVMDYGEFCAEKSCEYYIEWEFNNDTFEQPYRC